VPRAKASPLARRLAAARGVDLTALQGSGPGGRVVRADVERAAVANGARETDAAPTAPGREPDAEARFVDQGSSKGLATRQDLTRTQATIARRMAQSRATVPDIELRVEVNMSRVLDMRKQLIDLADPAPSLNDFVIKTAGLALREFPRVNGAYQDAAFEIYSRVNVGVAVAGEDTLVVPTIFDADQKSLAEIAAASRTLAAKVRDGSILPSELAGATFTVSNLGMYGIDSFTAVINQPQSAILAVGTVRPRPVVDEQTGAISAAPTMMMTLACDHRILYGVDGARFLARVRELLERPVSLLV
jgi:pyruvate dehydrogenase E2 component (dihydrolipoamide acetyltransferase)